LFLRRWEGITCLFTGWALCASLAAHGTEDACARLLGGTRPPLAMKTGYRNGQPVALNEIRRSINKISILIPIYRELENGNLQKLANRLAAQTLDPKFFQVVFVVNNSVEAARLHHSVFAENQRSLAWLRRESRRWPFASVIVDRSSEGIETNMGVLRQISAEAALQGADVDRDQHVLWFMDADTGFAPDHLARLREMYERRDVDVVISRFKFSVEDPRDLTSVLSHPYWAHQFQDGMSRRAFNYANSGAGTPQISVLAKRFVEAGGVPLLKQDEDFALMHRLSQFKVYMAPDLFVRTEDRARPDGYDAWIRWNFNRGFDIDKPLPMPGELSVFRLLEHLSYAIEYNVEHGRTTALAGVTKMQMLLSAALGREIKPWTDPLGFQNAEEIINAHSNLHGREFFNINYLFVDEFWREFPEPGVGFLKLLEGVSSPREKQEISDLMTRHRLRHWLAVSRRQEFLRTWLNEGREDCRTADDGWVELFCASNSELRPFLRTRRDQYAGVEDALRGFTELMPDWLGSWSQARFVRNAAAFEIIEELILRSVDDPGMYPGVYRYMNNFKD